MLRIIRLSEAQGFVTRKAVRLAEAEQVVAPILDAVRARGDEAVLEYARKFDGFEGRKPDRPHSRNRLFHRNSLRRSKRLQPTSASMRSCSFRAKPGSTFRMAAGWVSIVRPLESMGAYIPAGRYPLPSTLLMTVIPAQAARVGTICVTSPHPSPEILAVARFLGIENIFRIGGAQAIAALAFGTATVPKVDRIVGPGNIYVAAAKKLLAGEVGIDFVAGPTEIVIIADDADPRYIAADMLAQAEHDVEASSILLTTSRTLAERVALEVSRQLATLPTAPVACEAIRNNSAVILCPSLEDAVEASNRLAPEHLVIYDAGLLPKIQHAGSVFVGPNSPEAAGDYATGPNHVLPTSSAARIRGGLSSADFVKVISVQELTSNSLRQLAPAITTLARAEGLEAHARSIEVRLGSEVRFGK